MTELEVEYTNLLFFLLCLKRFIRKHKVHLKSDPSPLLFWHCHVIVLADYSTLLSRSFAFCLVALQPFSMEQLEAYYFININLIPPSPYSKPQWVDITLKIKIKLLLTVCRPLFYRPHLALVLPPQSFAYLLKLISFWNFSLPQIMLIHGVWVQLFLKSPGLTKI